MGGKHEQNIRKHHIGYFLVIPRKKKINFVLVSVSCPKALYHFESDNIFSITVVVADWLG